MLIFKDFQCFGDHKIILMNLYFNPERGLNIRNIEPIAGRYLKEYVVLFLLKLYLEISVEPESAGNFPITFSKRKWSGLTF